MKEIKPTIIKIFTNCNTLLQIKGIVPYDFVQKLLIGFMDNYEDVTVVFEEEK